MMAYGRDVQFHDACPLRTWLDRTTGNVLRVYENDDDAEGEGIPAQDNRKERERVATEPDRYLEIPGLDHGEHHEIFKQFLQSDWTDDTILRQRAEDAYFGSIGAWKKHVGDEAIVFAYYDFRRMEIFCRAEVFLQQNGIDPIWE